MKVKTGRSSANLLSSHTSSQSVGTRRKLIGCGIQCVFKRSLNSSGLVASSLPQWLYLLCKVLIEKLSLIHHWKCILIDVTCKMATKQRNTKHTVFRCLPPDLLWSSIHPTRPPGLLFAPRYWRAAGAPQLLFPCHAPNCAPCRHVSGGVSWERRDECSN